MRISDWSSDVCSSDLDLADPPIRPACHQNRGKGRLHPASYAEELRALVQPVQSRPLSRSPCSAMARARCLRQAALPPRQAATQLLFRPAMSDFTDPFDQIVEAPSDTALSDRLLVYALSTITARSLPDLRDGLKPDRKSTRLNSSH